MMLRLYLMKQNFLQKCRELSSSEEGATMVEYVVLVITVAAIGYTVFEVFGSDLEEFMGNLTDNLFDTEWDVN